MFVNLLKRQQVQAENPDLTLLSNSLQLLLGDPKESPDLRACIIPSASSGSTATEMCPKNLLKLTETHQPTLLI